MDMNEIKQIDLKEILSNYKNSHLFSYVLGNILSNLLTNDENYPLFKILGKNQKNSKVKHNKQYIDDYVGRFEKYFDVKINEVLIERNIDTNIANLIIKINNIENIQKSRILSEISQISDENILKLILLGYLDSKSSIDISNSCISFTAPKEKGDLDFFLNNFIKKFFNAENKEYNLNGKRESRDEQIRIKLIPYFEKIGTLRLIYFKKTMKTTKQELKKFISKINVDHCVLIYQDNHILNAEKIDINSMDKVINSYFNPEYSSMNFDSDSKKKIINKCKSVDYLVPEKKLHLASDGSPLLEFHHIIPRKYYKEFGIDNYEKMKDIIKSWENGIAISPDTHRFLHLGLRNDETRKKYIEELWKYLTPLLKKYKNENYFKIDKKYFVNIYETLWNDDYDNF